MGKGEGGLTADRFQKRRLCSEGGNARAAAIAATIWPSRQSSFAIAKFNKYPSATVYCLGSKTRNFTVNGEIGGSALCIGRLKLEPRTRSELYRGNYQANLAD
jgi:hypothetical protein